MNNLPSYNYLSFEMTAEILEEISVTQDMVLIQNYLNKNIESVYFAACSNPNLSITIIEYLEKIADNVERMKFLWPQIINNNQYSDEKKWNLILSKKMPDNINYPGLYDCICKKINTKEYFDRIFYHLIKMSKDNKFDYMAVKTLSINTLIDQKQVDLLLTHRNNHFKSLALLTDYYQTEDIMNFLSQITSNKIKQHIILEILREKKNLEFNFIEWVLSNYDSLEYYDALMSNNNINRDIVYTDSIKDSILNFFLKLKIDINEGSFTNVAYKYIMEVFIQKDSYNSKDIDYINKIIFFANKNKERHLYDLLLVAVASQENCPSSILWQIENHYNSIISEYKKIMTKQQIESRLFLVKNHPNYKKMASGILDVFERL